MSGIHTNQKFAVLDTTSGMNIDCYGSLDELLRALYYRTAVNQKYPLDIVGDNDDARLCDKILEYIGAVHEECRGYIIKNYDPKRLRAKEVWPFYMADSNVPIYEDRWYGFDDAGGAFYGTHDPKGGVYSGFASDVECLAALNVDRGEDCTADDWSSDPKDLGGVMACIITGRQYVDQLYALCSAGGSGWEFNEYGHWYDDEHTLADVPKHASDKKGMTGCGKCDDDPALCAWHQECQHPDTPKHALSSDQVALAGFGELLVEAWNNGQFADDHDVPQAKSVRAALRAVAAWLASKPKAL